ncbi:tetratricopeptide repeat protein [Flavobacterium sp.]|uniref:tetratricopeptide repeat protein n=1 Tax=Flavobacterium sp. TaxID=239 RepID=UPI00286CD3F9|nr:tetratricopeptide repeat protein [Flavobacterium sp.]
MKNKYVLLAIAAVISVSAFAQKDQLKAAEKSLKNGNSQEALTTLQGAESIFTNAADTEKAQFYFLKGNSFLDLANKNIETGVNLSSAAKSYQDLIAIEKASGKVKYSVQAAASITEIKYKLLNSAIVDSKANKHNEGAKKLYDAYLLDTKDTINLYYAASTYVNGKDFVSALNLYEDLKKLNYSGKGVSYLAVSKINNNEDFFNTKNEREIAVKLGTHSTPRDEAIPSKRGEIYKNIALILVQNGKIEEAKKAVAEARLKNPEDNSLILTEANLYLETKDFETYKKLISEAIEKNPTDADLIFNLGVISSNAKNFVEAEKYYNKVLEINPKYLNGYINIAALKLENEKVIIDEMNKLGTTSAKDIKRYDELKNKRAELFKSAIPYLVKAHEIDAKNSDVSKTLLGVYSALEMTAEYKALKEEIKKQ